MTVLLLIRHALTEATGKRLYGRTPGVHLSARGRGQAARLAERLAGLPLRAVYSSSLERCLETAEPVASAGGLPVQTSEGLLEVDYGRWTGRSFAQLARTAAWRRARGLPSDTRFPGGESLRDVQDRAVRTLAALADAHRAALVAVVTHGDVIRLSLAHFAGVHIDLFQRLEVAAASVSAVAVGEDGPRILRMSDTGDLGDLVPGPRRGGGVRR